jgi:hypothetical protein
MQTTYTIVDVGSLPHAYGYPYGFNNTGQIYGYASPNKNSHELCEVYTGSGWLSLHGRGGSDCTAYGMSNENAGTYFLSGNVTTKNQPYEQAMFGTVSSFGTAMKTFVRYYDSNLDGGVNDSGVAVGSAYQSDAFENYPPFVYQGGRLSQLQPQCNSSHGGPLCMSYIVGAYNGEGRCPFGGCAINDSNVVLGVDDYTGNLMVYTVGNPSSAADTPISWGPAYPAGINNANQIAYAYYNYSSQTLPAFIYQLGASAATWLGTIPGSDCQDYLPLSLNNVGDVMGYDDDCSSSPETYWVYDHTTQTMVDLATEIPPSNHYNEIYPLGINDNGQILAALYPQSGGIHWGFLNPGGSARRAPHGAHLPMHGVIR